MIHIDINLKIIRIAIEIEEGFPNKTHRYGNYFVLNIGEKSPNEKGQAHHKSKIGQTPK